MESFFRRHIAPALVAGDRDGALTTYMNKTGQSLGQIVSSAVRTFAKNELPARLQEIEQLRKRPKRPKTAKHGRAAQLKVNVSKRGFQNETTPGSASDKTLAPGSHKGLELPALVSVNRTRPQPCLERTKVRPK